MQSESSGKPRGAAAMEHTERAHYADLEPPPFDLSDGEADPE